MHQGPQPPHVPIHRQDTNISLILDRDGPVLYQSLLKHAPAIGAIIASIRANHNLEAQLEMALFSKVFEPYPLLDGALALIVCMATGLLELGLDFHLGQPLAMTRYLLSSVDWRLSALTICEYPIMHIRSVRIQEVRCQNSDEQVDRDTFTVLPGLQYLTIGGNHGLGQISHARLRATDSATLRTLTLKEVNFDPQMLHDMIQLPFARNLKIIAVLALGQRGTWDRINRPWEHYDYEKFKNSMLKHLPQLHSCIWLGMSYLQSGKGFGTFSGFTELIELHIDHQLMSNKSIRITDTGLIGDPNTVLGYFPPSLQIFKLCGVRWLQMVALLNEF